MNKSKKILIVGAGPSGLSMAIFLSELGYTPRIIDMKNEISEHSKALAINPRTLEIFSPYNITNRFLDNGRKMSAVNIWKADKLIYKNEFSKTKQKHPFLLILPQKLSEEILLDELQKRNIHVEYNTNFESFKSNDPGYEVKINDGNIFKSNFDYLIGADGGHSKTREQLNIDYKGFRYDEEWELYDIELDTVLNNDQGHFRLFNDGGMIMIRLEDNIWRVAGNLKSLLNYLPKKSKTGKIIWESKYRIHHKVSKRLVIDRAVLIGDAAHLHSPVGARGMNLGIEDAFIASRLLHENRLSEYDLLRRPYLEKTVHRINNITSGLAGHSKLSKFIRSNLDIFGILFPIIMPSARKFIFGFK